MLASKIEGRYKLKYPISTFAIYVWTIKNMNAFECGPGNKKDNEISVFDDKVLVPIVFL